jgi:hypothetical protein
LKYSIDTSAILDGWVRYYPPDVFPAVWARVEGLIVSGHLVAADEVLQELAKRDDAAYEWALRHRAMFVALDEEVQKAVSGILHDHERLVDTRRNRSAADPFVIGLAQVHQLVVVTGEPATGRPERPNIPDVCAVLGLRCISLLELIREQGWKFSS